MTWPPKVPGYPLPVTHGNADLISPPNKSRFWSMTSKTYYDLVREAKTRVKEVTASETIQILSEHPGTVVVDCREPNEAALGTIAGAVVIPRGIMESNIERVAKRDQKVIIYCAGGNRSALAADSLREMGYADVATMAGGFRAWIDAGGDIDG